MPKSLHAKSLTLALLVLAFLMRVEHRSAYRNLFLDTEVQVAAAHQAIEGQDFTWPRVQGEDWSQVYSQPLDMVAPGYSRLLAVALWVTQDPYAAIWWVDFVALMLIFGAIHGIFHALTGSHFHRNYRWYLIFLALSPAPLHYLSGSGMWALACLSLAWWLTIGKFSWGKSLLAIGLMVLAAWTRIAYLSLLPLLPICWLVGGLRRKDSRQLWFGAGIMLLAVTWLIRELTQSSVPSYYADQRGIFPEHLLQLEPFPFKAFLYYGLPHELALRGFSEIAWVGLQVLAYGVSLALVAMAIWTGWRTWRKPDSSAPARFAIEIFVTTVLTLGLLGYQSLTHPPETWNWIGFWTFLMEPRYYVPAMLGLVIWLFFQVGKMENRWLKKGLRLWLLAVTLAAYTYPLWLKIRLYVLDEPAGTFYADPNPAYLHALQQLADTTTLPLVAVGYPGSQAPAMVGVPTVEAEELEEFSTSSPIYLVAPAEILPELPPEISAEELPFEPGYQLWRLSTH